MTMSPEAKKALSQTIRGLRTHLLDALHSATEQAYRLSIADTARASLGEAARCQRERLTDWIDEQVRTLAAASGKKSIDRKSEAERFRRDAEKQAAYTLLNRTIMLRLLEAGGLRPVPVVTGGWTSRGFNNYREVAPALVRNDRSEGYEYLLRLIFEDLAVDLPGLFGDHGVASLIPVPPDTWRHLVETLDAPELAPCWTDDMTLGWVYQYWNDPEREALDAKLHGRGKLEPHEIASKTQMFTERYMVDWLLQNSLGPLWLAMCTKNGWTPEAQSDGTLARLDLRRANFREKRDRGEVPLTELMPLHGDTERRWAYYVPQPIPADAPDHAPLSVRDILIIDPAVGSGHFLVVAFDLLFALYKEEARHRGQADHERWSNRAIVEQILEHNLHGIDLDPRAIQIAAAALWLKARQTCPDAHPRQLNLVASNLRLASLPDDDPALEELRREVERDTGIPAKLTNTILHGLRDADHLGSLLQVDRAVEQAIKDHELVLSRAADPYNRDLFLDDPERPRIPISPREAKTTVLERLEDFLEKHTHGEDLGLRLRGEQLAAGIRFIRINKEGRYHLVVGNPPYQGTSKMANTVYVQKTYKEGKADLYAAFLQRGLQLAIPGGMSALLTMRNWMFIRQFAALRENLLSRFDLRALGDFDRGGFEEVPDEVVSVVVSVFHNFTTRPDTSVALQPTPTDDRARDSARTLRKRAATLAGVGRIEFRQHAIRAILEWPLVYWWDDSTLQLFIDSPLLEDRSPARDGLGTRNDVRFIRQPWEVHNATIIRDAKTIAFDWAPLVKGAAGSEWIEPLSDVIRWTDGALELQVWIEFYRERAPGQYFKNSSYYFRPGVAFSPIGQHFSARAHRFPSVFGEAGPSVITPDVANTVCMLNARRTRKMLQDVNPSINFKSGDINRIPAFPINGATEIYTELTAAITSHESHREPSVEFRRPGPSPWSHAQAWAQLAVDRPEGAPLPDYVAEHDLEPATDHLSYALGVALGRFGADGRGILDPTRDSLAHALPAGLLFLDTTLAPHDRDDGLGHPASAVLLAAWAERGPAIASDMSLRDWLAGEFFDLHRKMYENRPIHWPLSSEKRTFVAWISIHRWTDDTLRTLLADHLHRRLTRLDGELADLRATRDGADKKAARAADKRLGQVQKWREELAKFIADVEQCAEKGPPPIDAKCPPRAVDARYAPDLDDGVMINSAALWPLLTPQWKDPKKWWRELAAADDKKDYDWAHLAMRYWPTRVDAKCRQDPSLAVAHHCFWRYHPARAWAWELRLQDEISPDFRLTEPPYRGDGGDDPHRAAFLADHAQDALRLVQTELLRRLRKHRKPLPSYTLTANTLWSAHPDTCWQLEDAIILKQRSEFHLLSPDEPTARAQYIKSNPDAQKRRDELLRTIALQTPSLTGLPPDPDDDDETPDPADDNDDNPDA